MEGTGSGDVVNTTGLVRAGILVLPRGAVLKPVGNLGTFNSVGSGVPQAAEAAAVTGTGFFVGEWGGSILSVLLTPFAVFALFAYLVPFGRRRWLTAGLICTVLGAALGGRLDVGPVADGGWLVTARIPVEG